MSLVFAAANQPGTTEHETQLTVHEAIELYRQGNHVYLGYHEPTDDELAALGDTFGLHPLAIEDSLQGHQRAKMERYSKTYFAVLRPAVYLDAEEEIRFGETHIFVGERFVLWLVKDALRSATSSEKYCRETFELANTDGPATPLRFMHHVLDAIVDGYFPVIEGLENDGDEIEDTLFAENSDVSEISQRVYSLLNEVADFKRAVKPMVQMLDLMMGRLRLRADSDSKENVELIRRFRDVHDHAIHVNERVDDLRNSLENALAVNSTIVAERQNDDMKRISAWAAIMVAPTVIGSIYGMNFDEMPELHWVFGYPASLALMFLVSFILWVIFKRKEWL